MPYIKPEDRISLDEALVEVVDQLNFEYDNLLDKAGPLNYTITRIITGLMERVSYKDICVLTGVLENVKQELYRRAASEYEDLKIYENGDVPEYIDYERDANQ